MESRPQTVAVVEDDPSMRRSVRRLLNAYGFAVEEFPSAEAFLGRDPDSCAECVVLDIHLPGMSGLELRSRLTAAGSPLPVIFFTAIDDDAVRIAALQLGCVAFLRKPFPAELLIDAIIKALSGVPSR
ncbi:Response regulator receiver domain-containing protein [Mesorhizobium albiziae]|uniref:Response regulator receiver domain-containing protein n=1 Tax=Neomesorhizobium albiziae TaxID=335020 RepID=A0A1I4E6E8_9HYPH|nr:response regulator [Mesorhizobium albiziae]SFK99926.1 Response regulator receiver domain-containing protein [Mesorhizobium albiziae]